MSALTAQSLTFGAVLFVIGLVGFLTRRNLILMFLSLELMLAGVSVNFIAYGFQAGNLQGQFFTILILTVASCEAALALALIVSLFRVKATLDVQEWSNLHEIAHEPEIKDNSEIEDADLPPEEYPLLSPAGRDPLNQPALLSPDNHAVGLQKTDHFPKNNHLEIPPRVNV